MEGSLFTKTDGISRAFAERMVLLASSLQSRQMTKSGRPLRFLHRVWPSDNAALAKDAGDGEILLMALLCPVIRIFILSHNFRNICDSVLSYVQDIPRFQDHGTREDIFLPHMKGCNNFFPS